MKSFKFWRPGPYGKFSRLERFLNLVVPKRRRAMKNYRVFIETARMANILESIRADRNDLKNVYEVYINRLVDEAKKLINKQ